MRILGWVLGSILSWIFGRIDNISHDELDDDFFYSKPKYHGKGKHTSARGYDYEAFKPFNDIKERGKYKIDESFKVKGTFNFKKEVDRVCEWLVKAEKGTPIKVILEREPNNPHDQNAIKILIAADTLRPTMIGYMPREIAARTRDQLPLVELERIYQRREIEARTLVRRTKTKK